MPHPRVRVVVLNYNGGRFVERTFAALAASEWPSDRLELVMVDNASTDASVAAVAERFPDVRIIEAPANTGFPANNLALRDSWAFDFVALINNDAFVEPGWLPPLVAALDEDPRRAAACPRVLLASRFVDLEITTPPLRPVPGDPRTLGARVLGVRVDGRDVLAGVAGTAIHPPEVDAEGRPFRWTSDGGALQVPVTDRSGDEGPWTIEIDVLRVDGREPFVVADGDVRTSADVGADLTTLTVEVAAEPYSLVNNAGSVVLRDGSGADRGFLQRDGAAFDEPCDVFAWCGAAVLLRLEYLADVGLFDESFFMYYEDTDLSWRGQLLGWSYRYVPESIIRHVHAATSVEGSPLFRHYTERNRLAVLTKNAAPELSWRAPLRFLWSTAAYGRRDVLAPLAKGRRPQLTNVVARGRSFGAYLKMLPSLVPERRRIRGRRVRHDHEIDQMLVDTARVVPAEVVGG